MNQYPIQRSTSKCILTALMFGALTMSSAAVKADEGGVSFWVPGFFGSLAATPLTPGFSYTSIYYHTSVSAGADVAFARQVNRGNISVNFTGNLDISLKARADLFFAVPSYTFAERFLGGQATVMMLVPYGRSSASVNGTLTGSSGRSGLYNLGGPRRCGRGLCRFGCRSSMLRWNDGVHNYMTYVTANIPVGRYDPTRLANLGLGHNAVDAGGGYTYFNPATGREFSAVLGFTYNFENNRTQYQSGIELAP